MMEYLVAPEDIRNIANITPYFAIHFQEQLQSARLSLVLDILIRHGYLHYQAEKFQGNTNTIKASSNSWKLRLVSKAWRRILDTHFHKLPETFGWSRSNTKELEWEQGFCIEIYSEQASVQKFLNHFRATHQATDANPFVIPSLHINNESLQLLHWSPALLELLSLYGDHLKALKISHIFLPMTGNVLIMYQRLVEVINLAPNITSLNLTSIYASAKLMDFTEIDFPRLTNLLYFCAENVPHPMVFNAVIRNNPQLRQVRIMGYGDTTQYDHLAVFPLKNLTKLELEDFSIETLILLGLPKVNWPRLEELVLKSLKISEQGIMYLFELLDLKWGSTLKRLSLDLWIDQEVQSRPFDMPLLYMSRLEEFWFGCNMCHNLEFLLPCKESLKVLHIYIRDEAGGGNGRRAIASEQTIQFLSCASNPYDSNIWRIFNALKLVDCQLEIHLERETIEMSWRKSRDEWWDWKRNQMVEQVGREAETKTKLEKKRFSTLRRQIRKWFSGGKTNFKTNPLE